MAHLLIYKEEEATGPVQRDEAIALFGIIRTLRPKTVVEFGFQYGYSAFNFLCALDTDAKLYSYDISDNAAARARELSFDKRFAFIFKSQVDFEPSDIENRPIDFVFFDAAHTLPENITTFQRILPSLKPGAIIAIHDTGLWEKSHFLRIRKDFGQRRGGSWVTDTLYAHQPEERSFVNWVVSNHPDFGALHFHSIHTLRHGLSLLQRQDRLNDTP